MSFKVAIGRQKYLHCWQPSHWLHAMIPIKNPLIYQLADADQIRNEEEEFPECSTCQLLYSGSLILLNVEFLSFGWHFYLL